jgi:hypothetical protein
LDVIWMPAPSAWMPARDREIRLPVRRLVAGHEQTRSRRLNVALDAAVAAGVEREAVVLWIADEKPLFFLPSTPGIRDVVLPRRCRRARAVNRAGTDLRQDRDRLVDVDDAVAAFVALHQLVAGVMNSPSPSRRRQPGRRSRGHPGDATTTLADRRQGAPRQLRPSVPVLAT